jgi:hypothetical protein
MDVLEQFDRIGRIGSDVACACPNDIAWFAGVLRTREITPEAGFQP